MTTVAWDGRYLAADSSVCVGDAVMPWPGKKLWHWPTHHADRLIRAFAATGEYQEIELIAEWITGGNLSNTKPPLKDTNGIVVRGTKAYAIESQLVTTPIGGLYAKGVGREVAMGAMMAGAGARRAVAICIEICAYNRGPVLWYDAKTRKTGTVRA